MAHREAGGNPSRHPEVIHWQTSHNTLKDNLESHVDLVCVFSGWGMKPGNPEET